MQKETVLKTVPIGFSYANKAHKLEQAISAGFIAKYLIFRLNI
jgi:hypothetical protein